MLAILMELWSSYYNNPLDLDQREYIKELFKKESNENLWFLCLLKGELEYYYYLKDKDQSNWRYIWDEEYIRLRDMEIKYLDKMEKLRSKEKFYT